MTTTLNPCSVCGDQPLVWRMDGRWFVSCCPGVGQEADIREDAIHSWNHPAEMPAISEAFLLVSDASGRVLELPDGTEVPVPHRAVVRSRIVKVLLERWQCGLAPLSAIELAGMVWPSSDQPMDVLLKRLSVALTYLRQDGLEAYLHARRPPGRVHKVYWLALEDVHPAVDGIQPETAAQAAVMEQLQDGAKLVASELLNRAQSCSGIAPEVLVDAMKELRELEVLTFELETHDTWEIPVWRMNAAHHS